MPDPAALGDAANGGGGHAARSGAGERIPAPGWSPGSGCGSRETPQGAPHDGLLWVPDAAADTLNDERWWKGFLGVAAAFAAHSRTVSRSLFDHVTGLPDRAEFQAELEAALARAEETRRPVVLLLLGPDDFGWVNERLDRRSGDLVLREIATEIRAGLRSHDHVARYGGAIFTVILLDTPVDDSRIVAENVVRRLSDQRYHGGILRLEFSAGVAAADPEEPSTRTS